MFRAVFWVVLPCKMIVDRRFRGAYCLHHQGWVSRATEGSRFYRCRVTRWSVVVGDDRLGTGQWQSPITTDHLVTRHLYNLDPSVARLTHPWWRRQYAPLKRRSTIILHGSTTQKTSLNIILAAVRTWNLRIHQVILSLIQFCRISDSKRDISITLATFLIHAHLIIS
jgi:hypothetical protein